MGRFGYWTLRLFHFPAETVRDYWNVHKMCHAVRSIFYCDRAIVPVSDKACQWNKKAAYEDT